MHDLKTVVLASAACAVVAAPLAMTNAALAKSKHHHHASKSAPASTGAPHATESKQTRTGGQPGGAADKN